MIQRIQSVYLLLVAVLGCIVATCPLFELFSSEKGVFESYVIGAFQNGENLYGTWPLMAICVLNILISLLALFMFKNRILQIRLSTFNILLYIGFYCMLAFYVYAEKESFGASFSLKIPFILPLFSIILTFLAIKGIRKDEEVIRSLDRIR